MRHKTITLCPTSYEIAQGMTNFSGWVRKQLLNMQINQGKQSQKQFICSDCGTTLTTKGHDLHDVPHATRRLSEFRREDCNGTFQVVLEGLE
jgi:hypothetical protein